MVRSKRLLDGPAVSTGALKQAAVVTLPAATLPAGREHLPMAETLISAALRLPPPQYAQLHTLRGGKGPELYRSSDLSTSKNVILFGSHAHL